MQVTCPACQKTLQSQADLSGKSVKCKCGHTFAVPKSAASPATATKVAPASRAGTATATAPVATASSAKISVSCSCGKTLQAPAAAAGKAVKCPCGQVVKVPAQVQRAPVATGRPMPAMAAVAAAPAQARRAPVQTAPVQTAPAHTSPNPFGDISDDEWKNMVQAHAPKQVDTSKPKEKSAAAKMLDEARKDTGTGFETSIEAAHGFLNKTRAILVGLGILCMVRAIVSYWIIISFIDAVAGPDEEGGTNITKLVVTVFCGIDLGIGLLYITFGFLVSIFPLTCSISALVLFVLVEIACLILDPTSILSIRGWAFRIAIFGGLIQGINNAAYYSHLKAEEKAAKKNRKP